MAVRRLQAKSGAQVSHRAAPWLPYQITYKTYNGRADWPRAVLYAEIVRAVRSDGSSVESSISYRLDRSVDSQQRLLVLPGGIRIQTSERLGLMTATKDAAHDDALARQQLDPERSCVVSMGGDHPAPGLIVTRETLLGYETYKIVMNMKRYRNTFWRAPALGCAELRMLGEKLDPQSGQVVATSDRTATGIRAGEPDPALFELPKGLRNVSPAELAAAQAEACCHATLNDTELAALQPADQHFRKFRFDW
jgi:hypothetical protein